MVIRRLLRMAKGNRSLLLHPVIGVLPFLHHLPLRQVHEIHGVAQTMALFYFVLRDYYPSYSCQEASRLWSVHFWGRFFQSCRYAMVDRSILVHSGGHSCTHSISRGHRSIALQSNQETSIKLSQGTTVSSQRLPTLAWVNGFHGNKYQEIGSKSWQRLSQGGKTLLVHSSFLCYNCYPGFAFAVNCDS